MAAFINIALGLTNLLPIPALDGGRILFVLIEAVRGRTSRTGTGKHGSYHRYVGSFGVNGNHDLSRYRKPNCSPIIVL